MRKNPAHLFRQSFLLLAPLICFTAVAACGAGNSSTPGSSGASFTGVRTYKYAGSVQCSGGGLSLAQMQQQLTDAGVQVISASCGGDGYMYIAACGAPDGRIGIFEIPADQVQAASAAGFAPLTDLPEASKLSCP